MATKLTYALYGISKNRCHGSTQKAASLNFDILNRTYGFTVLIKRAEKTARAGRVAPDELGFSSKRKALPARAV
jgi:hypothetical protein